MRAVLHNSVQTTLPVRAELQASQASTHALVTKYGIDPKTVAKWRARQTIAEVNVAVHVLNRMLEFGRPHYVRIG